MSEKELWEEYISKFNFLAEVLERVDVDPKLLNELIQSAYKLKEADIQV